MSSGYAEITGLNELITKISKLEKLDMRKVVQDVAKDVREDMWQYASGIFPIGSNYIDVLRINGTKNVVASVGLDTSNWEDTQHLFYHQYGYRQYYYGSPLGYTQTIHKGWFYDARDKAIQGKSNELLARCKQEIYRCWR